MTRVRSFAKSRSASEPDALLQVLKTSAYRFKRIGLEAGPLFAVALQCFCRSKLAGDLCRDTAHAGRPEGADQQDRSQRCPRHRADDAGLYRPVHVKTLRSQKLRTLLTASCCSRRPLPSRTTCVRPCVTSVSRWAWSGRLSSRHASGSWSRISPDLIALVEPLLVVRRVLREQIAVLHRSVLAPRP